MQLSNGNIYIYIYIYIYIFIVMAISGHIMLESIIPCIDCLWVNETCVNACITSMHVL